MIVWTEDFSVDDYAFVCRLLRANWFTQPTLREQALAAVEELKAARKDALEWYCTALVGGLVRKPNPEVER